MDIRFVTAHSGRDFEVYIVGIAYHIPDGNTEVATIIITEDDFLTSKGDKTIPSLAYNKLCKSKGYAKGGLIIEQYHVETKKTQFFAI